MMTNTFTPKLSDKAILVKLTIRRPACTVKATDITELVRQQYGDATLTVSSKLFTNRNNPINQIMRANGEVYAYHKEHTLPYMDAGPRLLPNAQYFDFAQQMKQRIAHVDSLLAMHMPAYTAHVQEDLRERQAAALAAGRTSTASLDDYPSAEKFLESMSIDLRFTPLPDARHFVFDLSDEDIAGLERAQQDAAAAANADTVSRMLKPIATLVAKLDEYKGEKGQRWHDSLVANVVDGCQLARKLAITPTPELLAEIDRLESMAQIYLDHSDIIKGNPSARDDARRKLTEAAEKMAAFF